MNSSKLRAPRTNGHGHHQQVNTSVASGTTSNSEGAGSPWQPGAMPYQQSWPVNTSAGFERGFVSQPGHTSQDRPANYEVTEATGQYSYNHPGFHPTVLGGPPYQTYGWQTNGWHPASSEYGKSTQTQTTTLPPALGSAAARMPVNQSSVYYDSMGTNTEQSTEYTSPLGFADDRVECPYKCGTVLTGIHAVGNLTRHLKSKACPNSPKSALRHICPVYGCEREYARSDGLKVHMRRHHGAPPAAPRYGAPSADYEGAYEEEY